MYCPRNILSRELTWYRLLRFHALPNGIYRVVKCGEHVIDENFTFVLDRRAEQIRSYVISMQFWDKSWRTLLLVWYSRNRISIERLMFWKTIRQDLFFFNCWYVVRNKNCKKRRKIEWLVFVKRFLLVFP